MQYDICNCDDICTDDGICNDYAICNDDGIDKHVTDAKKGDDFDCTHASTPAQCCTNGIILV